jgi:ferredoxin-NADP reductase
VGEVTMRRWQSGKVFFLHRVKWSPPVLQLRFFPAERRNFVFKEGQYVHLMIEHISKSEWHPFTISSAFEDLDKEGFVSLHIRVMEKGTWTYKAKEYFKLLSGARPKPEGADDSFVLNLTHFDNNGMAQAGKHLGPDGLPLISINGPTAAPAQHYEKYSQVMLIGAGIGLTPCSSIIKSILKYKWKKGFKVRATYLARSSVSIDLDLC